MGSEYLQIAVDHDSNARALVDIDDGADGEVIANDAVRGICQIIANVFENVGGSLILDLGGGGTRRRGNQRDQGGRPETLGKARVHETSYAGATQFVAPERADLDGLARGQDDPVPGNRDPALRDIDAGAVAPDETGSARDQEARAIDAVDILGHHGTGLAGQGAVEGSFHDGLDHGALDDGV